MPLFLFISNALQVHGWELARSKAASSRILFDCHRRRYDTQFRETAKQDGFGRGSAQKPGPWKASRQTLQTV